jgi:hypothetical protein
MTDEEAAALTRYLRRKLDEERFPFASRLGRLKAILANLHPPAPRLEPRCPVRGIGGDAGETLRTGGVADQRMGTFTVQLCRGCTEPSSLTVPPR